MSGRTPRCIRVIRRFSLAELGLVVYLAAVGYVMYRALLVGIAAAGYIVLAVGGP